MKLLVFDTETTGLPPHKGIDPEYLEQWPYIVQISYVIYDFETNAIELKDHIIKIPYNIDIPQESTNIHGITKKMTNMNGVNIYKVFTELFYHIKRADKIIGHNIDFDINMINVELLRRIYNTKHIVSNKELEEIVLLKQYLYELQKNENKICTMKTNVELCNIIAINKYGKTYVKYPTLTQLHNKLFMGNINMLHDSSVDSLVTLRCYVKIAYNIDLLKHCKSFKVRTRKIYNEL